MEPPANPRQAPIGIAGAGRVARALGRVLFAAGEPVACVASRDREHARAAAAFIAPAVATVSYAELPAHAARFLIAVPDDAIESVAALIGADRGIALHTCGARGPEALAALARRGVCCGALHPLQTVPAGEAGVAALRGIAVAIDGDAEALEWAGQIAALLDARVLRIAPALRPFYHAAAVMASNCVVALIAAAESLMTAAGVSREDALPSLAPLARASLGNALSLGPRAALTGPIERGDAATVKAHVDALRSMPESVQALYRAAGRETLELARACGLPPAPASAIDHILRERDPR